MEINAIRNELSVNAKNGIGFLSSAWIIWSLITIIFLQPIEIYQKNVYMLFSTGLMFPLSIGISALVGADWKLKHNPLGDLGLYLNLAQIVYFPILFWGMIKSPTEAILFFSIITGAHFFPYGWFYRANPYYVMAPVISITIMVLGLYLGEEVLWPIPLSMVILLSVLILWATIDFKKKAKTSKG